MDRILSNIGANQPFELGGEEPIHPGMLEATYTLLNKWLQQDNNILMIEYNSFMKNGEMKKKSEKDIISETTETSEKNGKPFEGLKGKDNDKWKVNYKRIGEDWKMVKK